MTDMNFENNVAKRVLANRAFLGFEHQATRWGGLIVFGFGLAVYLLIQTTFLHTAMSRRATPIEPDDAYCYIAKAAEIETCPLQDCPALNDLRPQLVLPVPDETAGVERYRQFHRLFSFYSPLHAMLLAAAHQTGLQWEDAYNFLQLGGLVFMALALAIWLYALWGPGPAGLTLLLMAFGVLTDHGLHLAVPTTWALGIAFLTWAAVLRAKGPSAAGLLTGVAFMLAMHPAGRLYGLVAIALYWLLADRLRPARRWSVPLLAVGLIALAFPLPHIVTRPVLKLVHDPLPQEWSRVQATIDLMIAALKKINFWIGIDRQNVGDAGLIIASMALLLVAGFMTVRWERRRKIFFMAILLLPLMFADFAFPHPRYPALIFGRVWVPLAVLLLGAVGQAAWYALGAGWGWLRTWLEADSQSVEFRSTLQARGWHLVLVILLLMVFLQYAVYSTWSRFGRLRYQLEAMVIRGAVAFDREQPRLLMSQAGPNDRVGYLSETVMYYFLSYGALNRGAVYIPAVLNTDEEKPWLAPEKNIRFLTGYNPFVALPLRDPRGVPIATSATYTLRNEASRPPESLLLKIANPGGEAVLSIGLAASTGTLQTIALPIPAGFNGWITPAKETGPAAGQITLALAKGGPLFLQGIRADAASKLNWPWDQGITLLYSAPGAAEPPVEASFNTQALAPRLNRLIEVLADTGSTIVARVK